MSKNIQTKVLNNNLKKAVGGLHHYSHLYNFDGTMLDPNSPNGQIATQQHTNAIADVYAQLGGTRKNIDFTNLEAYGAIQNVLKAYGGIPGGTVMYVDTQILMYDLGYTNWS